MEHREKPRRSGETQSQDNCCKYAFLELNESRMTNCDVLGSHTIGVWLFGSVCSSGCMNITMCIHFS